MGGGIIKNTSKKLFILGIIFFIIMSISGIYATTAQITSGQTNTGGVDIEIQTFKLNNENTEIEYDDVDRRVEPAEVISFIPKIENIGESCYVRTKFFYINEYTDASDYITGISNELEKYGDYYYYKKILNPKESLKIFDTIKIPKNISEITDSKKIKLEIIAEAIQERNFEPDYTQTDPWKGIVPVKSTKIEYDIDSNNDMNITIKYENGTSSDVEVSGNFFLNMKNIMPGDNYSSDIKIKNKDKENAKYYLKLNLEGLTESEIELLNEIDLVITTKNGNIIYSGKIKGAENILLGQYNLGEEDNLDVKIQVPIELSNKYVGIQPKLNWIFLADYDKENTENSNNNNTNNSSSDNNSSSNSNNSNSDNSNDNNNNSNNSNSDNSNDNNSNSNNSNGNNSSSNNNSDDRSSNNDNPKTGDKINVAITIFLISSIGLVVVMLLDYKEKSDIE